MVEGSNTTSKAINTSQKYKHNTFLALEKQLSLPMLPPPTQFLKWNLGVKPLSLYRLETQGHPGDNQTGLTAAHCSEKHLCEGNKSGTNAF